jgi:2-phosphosulfolactate phosphatase
MNSVVIDFLPESVGRYRDGHAIVAVDVIRATTTLVTALTSGRRGYVASTPEHARMLAASLHQPLLAGELAGEIPEGFEIGNSPAEVARRTDVERPLVLLSSSGTQLLHNAQGCPHVYVACFRNHRAVADHIARRHARVALIGAGTRGEFREEDQICCAWIAARLIDYGYGVGDPETQALVARWRDAPAEACLVSKSVDYLRRSGQLDDLDFILDHLNDVNSAHAIHRGEVVCASAADGAEVTVADAVHAA